MISFLVKAAPVKKKKGAATPKKSGVNFKIDFDDPYDGRITALVDGKEAGSLQFWKERSAGLIHLQYVGVKPNFQRRGIADEGLKLFKKEMKKHGMTRVVAEITWTGAYAMMKKVFGNPESIGDAIRDYTEDELLKKLPNVTPANEDGFIDGADNLEVYWKL